MPTTTTTETGRFLSINDGAILLRNFSDAPDNWRLLNSTGQWQDGTEMAARFIINGELGAEDLSLAEANALAAKLGGDLAAARA